jgi:8-oxo-dGTP diphosphatase
VSEASSARRVAEIDWATWRPQDRATLVFILQGGRVLLIRKRRGLGAGKINGPGGRIEAGESARAGAVREVQEELRVTPTGLSVRGQLSFQFVDGYSIHAYVFVATGFDGDPTETEEALPIWANTDRIPYEQMWADDRLWVPRLVAGEAFGGRFVFAGDEMLDQLVWSLTGRERTALAEEVEDPRTDGSGNLAPIRPSFG